jgi:excinuclease ABC subunit B
MIEGLYDPQQGQLQLRAAQDQARYEGMSEKQVAREIRQMEKQMQEHARNLEFEKAAQARDRLAVLKKNLFGAAPVDEFEQAPAPYRRK